MPKNSVILKFKIQIKWGPAGSGCRAKTLARASDMSQCRFLTIRILQNLSPKSGKWHFRKSRFKHFPGEHALDTQKTCAYIRCSTCAFGTSTRGPSGSPDITLRHCCLCQTEYCYKVGHIMHIRAQIQCNSMG